VVLEELLHLLVVPCENEDQGTDLILHLGEEVQYLTSRVLVFTNELYASSIKIAPPPTAFASAMRFLAPVLHCSTEIQTSVSPVSAEESA
jgi:hypothetical protein